MSRPIRTAQRERRSLAVCALPVCVLLGVPGIVAAPAGSGSLELARGADTASVALLSSDGRTAAPPCRPLRCRRRPPVGVKAQLRYASGTGDNPCPGTRQRATATIRELTGRESRNGRLELGTEGTICLYSFSFRRPKAVRVEFPDGAVSRRTVPSGSHNLQWVVFPDHPLGRYRVTVTQKHRRAELEFMVSAATREWIVVADRQQRLGRPVRVVLTGLPPDTDVTLDLYRLRRLLPGRGSAKGDFRYINSVLTRTGPDGAAVHRIATSRADRPGEYLVRGRIGLRPIPAVLPDFQLLPPKR